MTFLDPHFAEAANQFSGVIYQRSTEGVDGNVVISPLSILTAISFLMFGASGRTLSQMKSSLKYDDIEDDNFKMNFLKLMTNLEGKNEVKMASKIYINKNYSIKPRFQEIATQIFRSEIETINFSKSVEAADNINQWVESKTNNKIRNLFSSASLNDETRLVLINAIYFKDQWHHEFDPRATHKDDFFKNEQDTIEVDYMSILKHFNHGDFKDLDATAVQLPFKSSNVTMMILLPNSKTGLPALESKLHQINFGDLSQRMSREDTRVIIPKFKIEFDKNLNGPLKKMGMDRMFSSAAEFDNLLNPPEPVQVSEAVHKAFIEVNEEGAEAAAATAIRVYAACSSCGPKRFIADRPFLFALIQNSTVLFIGRKVQ